MQNANIANVLILTLKNCGMTTQLNNNNKLISDLDLKNK